MKAAQGVRLLLVDDEPHILQFLELGLMNEGFEVMTAPDGVSAIAIAADFKPHVAILDVMMPGMDGFEVCRYLRSEEAEIAVIMLTAKTKWTTGSRACPSGLTTIWSSRSASTSCWPGSRPGCAISSRDCLGSALRPLPD